MRGRDPDDRTRQLCNAWKSDDVVAAQVLSERVGRLAAQLAGYRGVRILQDNVLWKPPGTKAIGFHQDSSYAEYLVPPEMITCWVSLHETTADAGPLEFVRGSHTWPKSPPQRTQFHAPDDWLAGPRAAVPNEEELDVVPVVVKAGGGSFHHGLTWHGSAPNTNASVARMALVSHMIPVEARFHETNVDVDVLALPAPRRPLPRRVVLPRDVGRVRLPHAVAHRAAGDRLDDDQARPARGARVRGRRRSDGGRRRPRPHRSPGRPPGVRGAQPPGRLGAHDRVARRW